MPVISVVNSKGGSGKSTTTLVLASILAADRETKVTIIDADRNQPLAKWRQGQSRLPIQVVSDISEQTIVRTIHAQREEADFVLVDPEGTASHLSSRAMMHSDLVVIPLSPSELEKDQAERGIEVIQNVEMDIGREINYVICFNRTNSGAVLPRYERDLRQKIIDAGQPMLNTDLNHRQAYISMFVQRLSLTELDPGQVSGLEKAVNNAHAFTQDVLDRMLGRKREVA